MSTLLYSATMSLDGFIAGPGGDMSWLSDLLDPTDATAEELMADIGALLIGRNTYAGDDPNAGTDAEGAFAGQWHGPMIVLTHRPDDVPADPDVVVATDLASAVATAKDAAAGRYVNVLGADVAAQCIEAGLLDEVLVFVAPILLGDGVRLFDRPGGHQVRLEPRDPEGSATPPHWYRVIR